jgi:hypothetical protein
MGHVIHEIRIVRLLQLHPVIPHQRNEE